MLGEFNMAEISGGTNDRIPQYLKKYAVTQEYDKYTSIDHATWRYIMRNSKQFFKGHAHSVYLKGLEETGIPTTQIPNIDEMDKILSKFGWGAVCVNGFIPPLAFLEFQSLKILPIAADMRTLDHITYTPAPDIVHEAAGHAPILADPAYRNYLEKYAHVARKAIFSDEDINLYEAIRLLSDAKENPDSSQEDIKFAEKNLEAAAQAITWTTEAAQVARMNWWTAEYGLIEDHNEIKIYGAGLLSSLSESQNCLKDEVKKIPLTLDCIKQTYDITRPQPQLFVAKSFQHLVDVLEELEETFSFHKGGTYGLRVAQKAKSTTTTCFSNGLQVSGILKSYTSREEGLNADQIVFENFVQISTEKGAFPEHGCKSYPQGFKVQLGFRFTSMPISSDWIRLENSSGTIIEGQSIQKFKIGNTELACLVIVPKDNDSSPEKQLFVFDNMITSVFGGPGDISAFGDKDFGAAKTTPARTTPFSADEIHLISLFQEVRNLKVGVRHKVAAESVYKQVQNMLEEILTSYKKEWLLGLEIVELVYQNPFHLDSDKLINFNVLIDHFQNSPELEEEKKNLFREGLRISNILDD